MLEEMGVYMRGAIPILEDNHACIVYATNDMKSLRAKHIDIKYHFIRNMIDLKMVKMVYCASYHQAADILTKQVDELTFLRHRATLMGLPRCP